MKSKKTKKYKRFRDLLFNVHPMDPHRLTAQCDLTDEYRISVVTNLHPYGGAYGNLSELTFEAAVFKNNEMIHIGVFDQVLGWQTPKQITKIMKKFQKK